MIGSIKAGLGIAKAFAIAHGPVALFLAGVVCVGCAIVETIKASTDSEKVAAIDEAVTELEAANAELKEIKETATKEELKVVKKRKSKAIRTVGKRTTKAYAKPIIYILLALVLLISGFWWQSRRLVQAAAAATAATTALNTVNGNIRKLWGPDGDAAVRVLNDPNFDPEKMNQITDLDTSKKAISGDAWRAYEKTNKITVDNNFKYVFSKDTVNPAFYDEGFIARLEFLQSRQALLNMKLNMPGVRAISTNEALHEIGLDSEQTKGGVVSGWKKGDYIDFGIADLYSQLAYMSAYNDNGQDLIDEDSAHGNEIILFMNPRGYILDDIFER